ncbi:Sup35, eukaryotic translation termination factor eRF3 [Ectocarpus siliculosus]|uniref:Sup35, eukaryotic translation termination factor eRF3 n=1 Tax=Ectocarpus siliculosus TaxID=2880 RepID=D7G008_ECTSI|nr:Sup35, eukaryotic translation termination factor eRF3 [Ectocarpus siliculosus]|eukprot:CBJ48633.1 Sup35, eukaryotic translation termination factor eRF3 [Ectocarpus siliculosus]
MAESWEDIDKQTKKSGGGLNPAAASFSFNPAVASWSPGGAAPAPAAAAAPAPSPMQSAQAMAADKVGAVAEGMREVSISSAPAAAATAAGTASGGGGAEESKDQSEGVGDGGDAEEMDENDPLWKATLQVANGDRAKALKMLEDPDALMANPEVNKIIAEGAASGDAALEVVEGQYPEQAGGGVAAGGEGEGKAARGERRKGGDNYGGKKEEKEEVVEKEATDEDPREHLNLVFIGHVDAGKSTLSGNILYLTDFVDKRTIERYEREAKQRNRESWFLAFIMDTNEEERAKGKTVEVGRAHFDTECKRYTILDAPGHNAYVPNMIQGAVQADVGILVISARKGEFETGFDRGGQTREHALLAKTLGVRYLVVVINKMDDPTVKWAKERFDECVTKIRPFLRQQCGYAVKKEVKFIPISGLSGANVKEQVANDLCPWWGPMIKAGDNNTSEGTLLELLDKLHMDDRHADRPLRVPVLDRYNDRGTMVLGKVEQGTLTEGTQISLMPTGQVSKVDSIFIKDERVKSAKPGENVTVKVVCSDSDVMRGFVLCSTVQPCHAATLFVAQIALVELTEQRPIFTAGYDAMCHCHTCEEECTVVEILSVVDRKTGAKKRQRFAKEGAMVTAKFKVDRSMCMESFEEMPHLGRFTLRTEGKTIAIGKILAVQKPVSK